MMRTLLTALFLLASRTAICVPLDGTEFAVAGFQITDLPAAEEHHVSFTLVFDEADTMNTGDTVTVTVRNAGGVKIGEDVYTSEEIGAVYGCSCLDMFTSDLTGTFTADIKATTGAMELVTVMAEVTSPGYAKVTQAALGKGDTGPTDPPDPPGPEVPLPDPDDWPKITYKPTFPPLGEYSLPGICQAVTLQGAPEVTLQDGETLNSAYARLRTIATDSRGGFLTIPWDVEKITCDNLRVAASKMIPGPLTIRGTIGPHGQIPRFYCRMDADGRDGTIPKADVQGFFIQVSASAGRPDPVMLVERIHSDGYKTAITMPVRGKVVLRNNYLHHGPSDGLVFGNNELGEGTLDAEICGNEISHFGQGNTIHNSYLHRSLGGAGDNPDLDGNSSYTKVTYIDNLCHSASHAHCYKSIANENVIMYNEFYEQLDTDPSYTKKYSTTLIDVAACALNNIQHNYIERVKPSATSGGDQMIGLRGRRTKVRGCDMPQMYGTDSPPTRIEGPWHTNAYWNDLNGRIVFPQIIEHNTFHVKGEFADRLYATTHFGTYPVFETGLGGDTCYLETPSAWYERAVALVDNNNYTNMQQDRWYRVMLAGHGGRGHCEKIPGYETPPPGPGPGPAEDMFQPGSGEHSDTVPLGGPRAPITAVYDVLLGAD